MFSAQYQLSLQLLTHYFGPVVSRVASNVLLHGPISLCRLLSHTHLDFKHVRNALVILLKYTICKYRISASHGDADSSASVSYYINVRDILNLPLISYGLKFAKEHLEPHVYRVYHEIALAGVTSPQHLKRHHVHANGVGPIDDVVDEAVFKLFSLGYLSNCDSFQQLVNSQREACFDHQHRRGDVLDNLQRDKFTLTSGVAFDGGEAQLYCVNVDYIFQHLLNEEITLLICKRVGDSPLIRTVIKILLHSTKSPVSLDYIETEAIKILREDHSQEIQAEQVARLLNGLTRHPDGLVVKRLNSYQIELCRVKDMLKSKAIFGVVREICGNKGARIWNLLQSSPDSVMDPQQVSQKALVSIHTARSVLYKLVIMGFANMLESDPTAAPNERQNVCFSANMEMTSAQVSKYLYKYSCNVMERLVYQRKCALGVLGSQALPQDPNAACDVLEGMLLVLINACAILDAI